MVVRLPQAFCKGLDVPDGGVLIYEPVEAIFAGSTPLPDLALYGAEGTRQFAEAASLEPVLAVELLAKHPAILQLDHATSTASPS
jgi:hypothetical protein